MSGQHPDAKKRNFKATRRKAYTRRDHSTKEAIERDRRIRRWEAEHEPGELEDPGMEA